MVKKAYYLLLITSPSFPREITKHLKKKFPIEKKSNQNNDPRLQNTYRNESTCTDLNSLHDGDLMASFATGFQIAFAHQTLIQWRNAWGPILESWISVLGYLDVSFCLPWNFMDNRTTEVIQ